MGKDDGRLVSVEINGLRYPIRSQLDASYVATLAAYVEEKMRLAARESPQGDTLKIAREERSAQGSDIAERTRQLERLLDLALDVDAAVPLARTAGSH
jgi:hypothetical protein